MWAISSQPISKRTPVFHFDLHRDPKVERVSLDRLIEKESLRLIFLEFLDTLDLEISKSPLQEEDHEFSKFEPGFQELFNTFLKANPYESEEDFELFLSHIGKQISESEEFRNVKLSPQVSMCITSRKNRLSGQANQNSTIIQIEEDLPEAIWKVSEFDLPSELEIKIGIVVGNSLKFINRKDQCFYFERFRKLSDHEIEREEQNSDATLFLKGEYEYKFATWVSLNYLTVHSRSFWPIFPPHAHTHFFFKKKIQFIALY